MKIQINLTNKWLYSLMALLIILILSISVWAYQENMNSGDPPLIGHSAGEIHVDTNGDGTADSTLQEALNNINSGSRESITFEVYNSDTSTYACVQKDLEEYCGDSDGCEIKLLMQHETDGNDQVRVIEQHIFMEQDSMSNNNGAGTYGWRRQHGGSDHSWITGTSGREEIYSPWGWTWAHNYIHDYCPGQSGHGPAFSDPYKFNFMSHPHIRTKVIVYD